MAVEVLQMDQLRTIPVLLAGAGKTVVRTSWAVAGKSCYRAAGAVSAEMPASGDQRGQGLTPTARTVGLPPAASRVTPDANSEGDGTSRIASSLQI
jgi:hypothetical protein